MCIWSTDFSKKPPRYKFHRNPCSCSMLTDGQIDKTDRQTERHNKANNGISHFALTLLARQKHEHAILFYDGYTSSFRKLVYALDDRQSAKAECFQTKYTAHWDILVINSSVALIISGYRLTVVSICRKEKMWTISFSLSVPVSWFINLPCTVNMVCNLPFLHFTFKDNFILLVLNFRDKIWRSH